MLRKYDTCTEKLRFSSWSCESVRRVLDLYYKVGIFELEMRKCTSRTRLVLHSCDFRAEQRKCTSRTRLVLQSCDFRAGDAEVYFAYLTCTRKLRFRAGDAEVYVAY